MSTSTGQHRTALAGDPLKLRDCRSEIPSFASVTVLQMPVTTSTADCMSSYFSLAVLAGLADAGQRGQDLPGILAEHPAAPLSMS